MTRHSSWRTVTSIHRIRDTDAETRCPSPICMPGGAIIKMTSRKRKVRSLDKEKQGRGAT